MNVVAAGLSETDRKISGQGPALIVRRARYDQARVAERARRGRVTRRILGLAVPLGFLLLWQIASSRGWIDNRVYPSPIEVVEAWWLLWSERSLSNDIYASFRVITIGFAIGSAVGIAVGIVTGLVRVVRAALDPLLSALYVVPKLALLPIFLTIFGLGEKPKIALVVVTVFFFVWISTMESLTRVAGGHVDAAHAFGAGPFVTFWHVHLPAMLPELFVALRISMGVAVLVTIAAEYIVSGAGLGFVIFNNGQLFLMGRAWAGIVSVAVLGVILMSVVGVIGRRLAPWERVDVRQVL